MKTPLPVLTFCFFNFFLTSVNAIDCFKCVSVNGNYQPCEDPFHNNYTVDVFQSPCMTGRKGRDGLFPATSCVKINGVFDDSGETIVVRGCALDSGTLTTDTELVRMSHCGGFFYDSKYVRGCVQTCNDADACNSTNTPKLSSLTFYNYCLLFLIWYVIHFRLQVTT